MYYIVFCWDVLPKNKFEIIKTDWDVFEKQ